MKEKLQSVDELLLGLAQFLVMLFVIALVFGVGFSLFILSIFSSLPIIWIVMGTFEKTWYLFPLGVLSIYLFRVWIQISPKLMDISQPKSK